MAWLFLWVCALAGALTTLHLYHTFQMEVDRIDLDWQTKAMWHERIWSPDNESG